MSGALGMSDAELLARLEGLKLKEAATAAVAQSHQSRPSKPKRSESHRNSMYSHRNSVNLDDDNFLRIMDEEMGGLHLEKPNTPGIIRSRSSRKGRATPAPPASVVDDLAPRRKRRDSAQYLSGGGGLNKAPPAAPNAPSYLDHLGVPSGLGGRSSFGNVY